MVDTNESIISSMTGDYTNSLLDEFTLGKDKFFPTHVSRYSCHTSTIPFCTTIDFDFLRKRIVAEPEEKFLKEYHGPSHRHVGDCECNPNYCQFVNKDKKPYNNYIIRNCPCTQVCGEVGKELSPLCYLSFVKTLSHNLKPSKKTLDPHEVMFCHDSKSIFDNKYPPLVRQLTGMSGFGHARPQKIIRMLDMTYWFRKFGTKYKLRELIPQWIETVRFPSFIQALKQSMHTINGLLIKKFMAFGPEIVSYRLLNEQIARLFRDFMTDYLCPSRKELPAYMGTSIFEEAKNFFNYVKEFHDAKGYETRISWLDYSFNCRSLGSFFGTELSRLKSFIDLQRISGQGDYSLSLAWNYRCVEICQTRNLGYLPTYIANEQAKNFRDMVSRPLEPLDKKEFLLIKALVHRELHEAKMKPGTLFPDVNLEFDKLVKECVKLELKASASYRSTVSQGGKLEDARYFLQMIRENEWRIPIRDLEDLEIVEYTPRLERLVEDNDYGFDLSSILFWFSFQNVINFCIERRLWPNKDHYFPFLYKGKPGVAESDFFRVPELLNAQILLINEPGKGRKLVKSYPLLNWFLIPGSKLCQNFLAQHPDHRAGLEMGAHDWVHSKRTSGSCEEAYFMFNEVTGRIRPEIQSGFTDWTEATDRMSKRRGIAHLTALFEFTGFPQAYAKLIIIMIREPQPVRELIQKNVLDELSEESHYVWNGHIREGFMMGNQITKTLLHLCHVSERALANLYMKGRGITVMRDSKMMTTAYKRLQVVPYSFEEPGGKLSQFPLFSR